MTPIQPGRTKRSFLDRFVFALAIIFLHLSWLPSVPAATNCEKVIDIPPAECNALINFYNNTDGGHWSDNSSNNWNVTDTPCTDWAGITCSSGHVTFINREKQNLSGSIPDLSALTNLQFLDLRINQLSGTIPDLSALTNLLLLDLSSNQLSSSIPVSLSTLTNLGGLCLDYNRFTAQDPKLLDWLMNLSRDCSWADTQTIPPTDLQATVLSENSIQISWTPILYTGDGGYYQVKYAADSNGLYISAATTTADKSATSYVVTNLSPNTTYYFVVETFTPKHDSQQNDLISDLSIGISATTKALPEPSIQSPLPLSKDSSTSTSSKDQSTSSKDKSTSSQSPSTSAQGPSTSTKDPSTSAQGPSTSTKDPSNLSQGPSTSTKDPSNLSQGPSTSTKDPSNLSQDPSISAKDPLNSAKGSLAIPIISTTPLPQSMNLTITFSGNGHGRITINPNGINCNSSEQKCSYFLNTTSWITVIATPDFDSKFTGWTDPQSDCDNDKVFMSDNRSCTASFRLLRFPLTVTTVGKGKVNITTTGVECHDQCQYPIDINTKVTLTTVPEDNWQFDTWKGDCDANGQVTVDKEKQCQAVFVKSNRSATGITSTDTSNASPKLNNNKPSLVDNCSNKTSSNCSSVTTTSPPLLGKSKTTVPVIPTDELKPSTEMITLTENQSTVVAEPHLSVSPASYDFGKITVSNTSLAQVFTITNIGEANLPLGQLTISNQEFTLTDGCSNKTLGIGNQCFVTVIFQPQSVGMKLADLAIPINNPNQDTITIVSLKGNGNIVTVNRKAIDSHPLLVTLSSPLTAVVTPEGVKLDWEIAATDNNPIAEVQLWKAQSVNGDCPQDINQYDQRTALKLKNEPHLDHQGTNMACYGLQLIEYSGETSWYITQAR